MGILDAPALSRSAADARYLRPPTNAGARQKPYDSVKFAYNFKSANTLGGRAKLAAAFAGLSYAEILCLGDSKTAGLGTNGGGQYLPARSYPGQLLAGLASRGYSVSTGWVYPAHNLSVAEEPRLAYTGSWAARNVSTKILYASSTGAGTLTFTSDRPGTIAEIQYLPTSAGFTYSIDGAAAVTVTPSGSGTTPVTVTVTGLSNATHTIAINAAATGVLVQAFRVRNATGVGVSNAGIAGSTATDWIQQGATPGGTGNVVTPAPDAVFIQLGINDCRTGIAVATFSANLAAIVSRFHVSIGKTTILVVPMPPQVADTTTAKWQPYASAIYDVADQYDIPVLDVNDCLVDWATANAAGLTFDSVHENDGGYATTGSAALRLLT